VNERVNSPPPPLRPIFIEVKPGDPGEIPHRRHRSSGSTRIRRCRVEYDSRIQSRTMINPYLNSMMMHNMAAFSRASVRLNCCPMRCLRTKCHLIAFNGRVGDIGPSEKSGARLRAPSDLYDLSASGTSGGSRPFLPHDSEDVLRPAGPFASAPGPNARRPCTQPVFFRGVRSFPRMAKSPVTVRCGSKQSHANSLCAGRQPSKI